MLRSQNMVVRVEQRDWGKEVLIAPMLENPDGSCQVAYMAIDGSFLLQHIPETERIDSSRLLRMPAAWAKSLLKALLEEFGDPEKDATTQELKAVRQHLEDFRALHFAAVRVERP